MGGGAGGGGGGGGGNPDGGVVSPSGLTYSTNPAVYTKGTSITANTPSSSGGPVASYSVSPALPAGLTLNPSTGIISGTATAVAATQNYVVTATNAGGNAAASLSLTVNDLAPSGLAYSTNPASYVKGTAITANTPTAMGGAVVSWSVLPALPAGLALDSGTGILSGTPTAVAIATSYVVTATNSGGNATVSLSIEVKDAAPSALTYSTNPAVYTKGVAIAANTPSSMGGAVVSFSVLPALPAGLVLSPTTGIVSGTPTALAAVANYTVTATNSGGSTTAMLSVTVKDVAPSALVYSANPAVYVKGTAITANTPTSGGGAVVSYAVAPALPAGLTLSPTTGIITGTPTAVTAAASYTVTATNSGGNTTASLNLTVNDVPIALVITEFAAVGPASGELFELTNIDTRTANLSLYTVTNKAGQSAIIHAASDPTGALGTAVTLAPGAFAYGVPNPTSAGSIPAGAAFVYGAPGTAFNFADTGDVLTVKDVTSTVIDVVDFTSFHSDPTAAIPPGKFPGLSGKTTQLDPTALTAVGNNDGNAWCVTFRGGSTAGAANKSCQEFVINEVLYDFAHPTLGGADDTRVFIELAGPGGGSLAGVRVLATDSAGTVSLQPDTTLAAGTRMPVDGIFVIADGDLSLATNVPNPDLVLANAIPGNGDSGNAIKLFASGGGVIDTVGYGPSTTKEGTALSDLNPDKVAISIARDANSTDTNNNAADFHFDPTPTPGAKNDLVVPAIVSLLPADGLASTTTATTLVVRDFADFQTVNGVAPADNDVNATFVTNVTPDTAVFTDGCTFTAIANEGRGNATLTCTAPTNLSVVARGNLVLTNPAAIGGAVTMTNGWTYTGVKNETDAADEADYCVLQFPATTSTQQGMPSELIYGRIFEDTVTQPAGGSASVTAQAGYGPIGSNPTTLSGWIFSAATFNLQSGNDDEYMSTMTAPAVNATTHFAYTTRFSLDNGLNWTYCDLNGAGSNVGLTFETGQLGDWTVTP